MTSHLPFASALALAALAAALPAQDLFRAPRYFSDQRDWRSSGDIDLDGDADLIGARQNGPATLWRNDGMGNLTPSPIGTLPFEITGAAAIGDFNGDGRMDAAFGVWSWYPAGGGGLLVFPQNASGGFGASFHVPAPGGVVWMRASETNGDGISDFLLGLAVCSTCYFDYAHAAAWLVSSPTGHVAGPAVNFTGGASVHVGRLMTFDVDGVPPIDLVAAAGSGGAVVLSSYRTLGQSLVPGPSAPIGIYESPVAADIDADGDDDIVGFAVNSGGSSYVFLTIHRNSGNFNFATTSTPATPYTNAFLGGIPFAGDWNGDGFPDILVRGAPLQNATFSVDVLYQNDGTGNFLPAVWWPVGATVPQAVGYVDLNQDGREDFVGRSDVMLSDGVFEPVHQPLYAVAANGLFDLDRDGDPDYHRDSPANGYILNDGTGVPMTASWTYAAFVPPLPPGTSVSEAKSLDLDGDGLLDQTVLVNAGSTTQDYRSYRRNPDLTLSYLGSTFITPGLGFTIWNALSGDLNADGRPDLVMNQGLAYGLGNGAFAPIVGTWAGVQVKALGDIDGDGDLDVLVTNVTNSSGIATQIGICRNLGNANFQTILVSDPAIAPRSVIFADADDDGDLDVVYIRSPAPSATSIAILENVGGGLGSVTTLPIEGLTPAAASYSRLFAGDLDLDGRTDLVALHSDTYEANRASVVRRSGAGLSFTPYVQYTLRGAEGFADMDGDGDLDAAGAGISRNLTRHGPGAGFRRQYGQGTPATGTFPVLGATGPFRTGSSVTLRARGFPGGAPAILTLGSQAVDLPGLLIPSVTTYVWPWAGVLEFPATGGPPGIAAAGILDLTVTLPPSFANQSFYLQFAFADPAAAHGISATNGLEIRVGN